MVNQNASESQGEASTAAQYAYQGTRHGETLAYRTAEGQAAYLLPHLRPGMDLLDCGCGPGSITLGLALAVAPGNVVGVDIQPGQVEAARALAEKEGVTNARFQAGDVYQLPFPDSSFDAVHANATVMYLKDPLRAFTEMRRVLKPGGVLGVRDGWEEKYGGAPMTPLLEELLRLLRLVSVHTGRVLDYPPRQRQLLLEAGFVEVQASADAESFATTEGLQRLVTTTLAAASPGSLLVATSIEQGWADEATWEAIRAEWRAFAERPDAFFWYPWCSAVGWKPQ